MKEIQLLLLIVFSASILLSIERTKRGYVPEMKHLPGIDSLSEGIGRAVETGRQVFYIMGRRGVSGNAGTETIASLGLLTHVSKEVAEKGAKMTVIASWAETIPMAEAILKEAYLISGKPEEYSPEMLVYIPGARAQWGYHLAVMGMIHRLRPATVFLFGGFMADGLMNIENAHRAGAFIVSGTASTGQMPWFMTHSNYFMIGEEFYAAGAYASKDPIQMGSVIGQDINRLIVLVIAILGMLLTPLGIPIIQILIGGK